MWVVMAVFVAAYLLIAFVWGAVLNGLTAPAGDRVRPEAVRHGLLWPWSVWRLMR